MAAYNESNIQKVKKSISMNDKAVKTAKEAISNGKDVEGTSCEVYSKKEQNVKDENEQNPKPNVKKEQDVKIKKEQDVKRIRLNGKGEEASSETNTEWVRTFNIVLKFSD